MIDDECTIHLHLSGKGSHIISVLLTLAVLRRLFALNFAFSSSESSSLSWYQSELATLSL